MVCKNLVGINAFEMSFGLHYIEALYKMGELGPGLDGHTAGAGKKKSCSERPVKKGDGNEMDQKVILPFCLRPNIKKYRPSSTIVLIWSLSMFTKFPRGTWQETAVSIFNRRQQT